MTIHSLDHEEREMKLQLAIVTLIPLGFLSFAIAMALGWIPAELRIAHTFTLTGGYAIACYLAVFVLTSCIVADIWYGHIRRLTGRSPFSEEQLEEMKKRRHEELMGWLVRQVTPEEAESMPGDPHARSHMSVGDQRLARRISCHIRKFLAEHYSEGDELWYYDNGEEAFRHLGGDCGFVILRDGEIKEFYIVAQS